MEWGSEIEALLSEVCETRRASLGRRREPLEKLEDEMSQTGMQLHGLARMGSSHCRPPGCAEVQLYMGQGAWVQTPLDACGLVNAWGATYYLLLTTYYLLHITYYSLFTANCLLFTTYYLLLTTYYLLLTTPSLRLTAYYLIYKYLLLLTAHSYYARLITDYRLLTTPHVLLTAY